jgi:hypothetical protein
MSAVGPDAELCAVCSLRHSAYLTCESAARIVLDDWTMFDDAEDNER